jgi:hypothetical protein
LSVEIGHPVLTPDELNNGMARWPTTPENIRCAEGVRQSLSHIDIHHQIAGTNATVLRRNQIGAPVKPLR